MKLCGSELMTRTSLRVLTVLARHGTAKYANALPDIQAMFARQVPDVAHDVLVADNSLPPDYHEALGPNVELIGASNAAWEFSAWDSGIAYLGERLEDYDLVHLATSAFRQLYVRYLDLFSTPMLQAIQGRAAAVGHIDYYNSPVSLLGIHSQSWIRSSFIVLPPAELRLLRSLVSLPPDTAFFSGDSTAPFRQDAPVSEGYRQNILGWLTGDGTGQDTEWHSRFCLTPETLPFFKSKALAIFNEQMLTNRLRAQGCAVVDATWLSGRLSHSSTLGAFPTWRIQVTERNVDAAPKALLTT
jgi:hypothetical protein